MKERLCKLLTVKSLVTLLLTVVFGYLSIAGKVSDQEFLTVFTVIISFYFGTQYEKSATAAGGGDKEADFFRSRPIGDVPDSGAAGIGSGKAAESATAASGGTGAEDRGAGVEA